MATLQEGLVISHLGQGIAVEHDGKIILCQTLRKLETVAVGDKVMWSLAAPDQGRIEEILPRRSVLTRPSRNDKLRPVAVNLDRIFVVFAVEPHCDFLLLDQYLAVCENNNIDAALILNKTDLYQSETIETELKTYTDLGYQLYRVSAKQNHGLDTLKNTLKDQVSMLAGQSGVGKSSLTNALIPDKDLKTNTISRNSHLCLSCTNEQIKSAQCQEISKAQTFKIIISCSSSDLCNIHGRNFQSFI